MLHSVAVTHADTPGQRRFIRKQIRSAHRSNIESAHHRVALPPVQQRSGTPTHSTNAPSKFQSASSTLPCTSYCQNGSATADQQVDSSEERRIAQNTKKEQINHKHYLLSCNREALKARTVAVLRLQAAAVHLVPPVRLVAYRCIGLLLLPRHAQRPEAQARPDGVDKLLVELEPEAARHLARPQALHSARGIGATVSFRWIESGCHRVRRAAAKSHQAPGMGPDSSCATLSQNTHVNDEALINTAATFILLAVMSKNVNLHQNLTPRKLLSSTAVANPNSTTHLTATA